MIKSNFTRLHLNITNIGLIVLTVIYMLSHLYQESVTPEQNQC